MKLLWGYLIGAGIILVLFLLLFVISSYCLKDNQKIKVLEVLYPHSIISKQIVKQDGVLPANCSLIYRDKLVSEDSNMFSSVVQMLFGELIFIGYIVTALFYLKTWLVSQDGCPADVINKVAKWECLDKNNNYFDCYNYTLQVDLNTTGKRIEYITCYSVQFNIAVAVGLILPTIKAIFVGMKLWSGLIENLRKSFDWFTTPFIRVLKSIVFLIVVGISAGMYVKYRYEESIPYYLMLLFILGTMQVDDAHDLREKVQSFSGPKKKLVCELEQNESTGAYGTARHPLTC